MPRTRAGGARTRRRGPRAWAPLSTAYVLALAGTTATARAGGTERARQMKVDASTDVAHLRRAPGRALVKSAFVMDDGPELVQLALVAAALAPLERRLGSARVGAILLSGHVVATLATQLPIALAIAQERLPASSAHRIDVGPSFGVFAALGAGCGQVPRPFRAWALLGLVAAQSALDAVNRDPVSGAGHAIAIGVGVASWPLLP